MCAASRSPLLPLRPNRHPEGDPIELKSGENLYEFSPNINSWFDPLGLSPRNLPGIASGSGNSIGKKWLKGTYGNFHKEILDPKYHFGRGEHYVG